MQKNTECKIFSNKYQYFIKFGMVNYLEKQDYLVKDTNRFKYCIITNYNSLKKQLQN